MEITKNVYTSLHLIAG